jgi:hypothetical protein
MAEMQALFPAKCTVLVNTAHKEVLARRKPGFEI